MEDRISIRRNHLCPDHKTNDVNLTLNVTAQKRYFAYVQPLFCFVHGVLPESVPDSVLVRVQHVAHVEHLLPRAFDFPAVNVTKQRLAHIEHLLPRAFDLNGEKTSRQRLAHVEHLLPRAFDFPTVNVTKQRLAHVEHLLPRAFDLNGEKTSRQRLAHVEHLRPRAFDLNGAKTPRQRLAHVEHLLPQACLRTYKRPLSVRAVFYWTLYLTQAHAVFVYGYPEPSYAFAVFVAVVTNAASRGMPDN